MTKFVIAVVIILLVAGGWFWSRHRGEPADAGDSDKPVARVSTATVKRQAISRTLEAYGIVAAAPSGDRAIAVAFDSVIRRVFVSAGDRVTAGQVLVELDPAPEAKLALETARSVRGLAAKALVSTQQRYDLKLATGQDLLAAEQAEAQARLQVSSLESRGLAGDGLVKAPAAGIVSKMEIQGGMAVAAGTPIVVVALETQLEARLGIEARDMNAVRPGQQVVLRSAVRGSAEKALSTVRTSGGSLDPVSGTAELRVPIPEEAQLVPGEHVVGLIEVEKREAALVVPRSAVLPDDNKQYIFLVKDGKVARKEVQVGLSDETMVEVAGAGLQAGDVVVVVGNYELEDGMAVDVAETGSAGNPPARETKP